MNIDYWQLLILQLIIQSKQVILSCHEKHQITLFCKVGDARSRQKFGPRFQHYPFTGLHVRWFAHMLTLFDARMRTEFFVPAKFFMHVV